MEVTGEDGQVSTDSLATVSTFDLPRTTSLKRFGVSIAMKT
jgi:hypothetical protein